MKEVFSKIAEKHPMCFADRYGSKITKGEGNNRKETWIGIKNWWSRFK